MSAPAAVLAPSVRCEVYQGTRQILDAKNFTGNQDYFCAFPFDQGPEDQATIIQTGRLALDGMGKLLEADDTVGVAMIDDAQVAVQHLSPTTQMAFANIAVSSLTYAGCSRLAGDTPYPGIPPITARTAMQQWEHAKPAIREARGDYPLGRRAVEAYVTMAVAHSTLDLGSPDHAMMSLRQGRIARHRLYRAEDNGTSPWFHESGAVLGEVAELIADESLSTRERAQRALSCVAFSLQEVTVPVDLQFNY